MGFLVVVIPVRNSIPFNTGTLGFSRLPLETNEEVPNQIDFVLVDNKMLKQATQKDPLFSRVLEYTRHGWPTTVEERIKLFGIEETSLPSKLVVCCGG